MDVDLKQELSEHQTLQDGIIKKIRESIKKQEAKENPPKLFRVILEYGMYSYINPESWGFVEVDTGRIYIGRYIVDNCWFIYKYHQKDNDYQKILDHLNHNSVDVSELVSNWGMHVNNLRDVYIHVRGNCDYYIKLSKSISIQIMIGAYRSSVRFISKHNNQANSLDFAPDDPVLRDFQKLCDLLSQ